MRRMPIFIAVLIFFTTSTIFAKTTAINIDDEVQKILNAHHQKYKDQEYFSGTALSVYIPNEPIHNYYAGVTSHDITSQKISAHTLFQIGSITKSFTAAMILQLEKEGKLTLTQPIKNFIPAYSKWGEVKMETLLNMSSGLPNYSDAPLWNAKEFNDEAHSWSNQELIDFVYPKYNLQPPLKSGYYYTNTGYVLLDLIVEKMTGHPFQEELTNRTIKRAHLSNTYYPVPIIAPNIQTRIAHGYSYNQYENPELLGADLTNNNLSWAGAAGAIVSNTEDIIKWVQALFLEETVLDSKQKNKLESMISLATGKPITEVTEKDPHGFGLGVTKSYDADLGRFWFYEGETLGFRALYVYVPCNKFIIANAYNSATNSENDHSKELIKQVYKLVLDRYAGMRCKS